MRLRVIAIVLGLLPGLILAGCADNSKVTVPGSPVELTAQPDKIMLDPSLVADYCKIAGEIEWDTIRGAVNPDMGGVIIGQPASWPVRCAVMIEVNGNAAGGGSHNQVEIAVRVPSFNSSIDFAMYELDLPVDIPYSQVTATLPYLPWLAYHQDLRAYGLNCNANIGSEIPGQFDDQMCTLPVFTVDFGNIFLGDTYGKIIIDDPPGGD
jgi:hypothetical protein